MCRKARENIMSTESEGPTIAELVALEEVSKWFLLANRLSQWSEGARGHCSIYLHI